jgi:hypothetical protein
MKTAKLPILIQEPRQLNLLFESSRLIGFSLLDRSKARIVLAQILMQAAGLGVEGLDDDKH